MDKQDKIKTLMILESPFAGEVEENIKYARACLLDMLQKGEYPIASHLLYTQVLDDLIPEHRKLGIDAGLAWRKVAEGAAFYTDRGWSKGMLAAKELYEQNNIYFELRSLTNNKSPLPI